jgi:signal transduction histidine kinase
MQAVDHGVAALRQYLADASPQLVENYKALLMQEGNPLGMAPMESISRVIQPILAAVLSGDPSQDNLAASVGRTRAEELSNPMHSLRAASALYGVCADAITEGTEAAAVSPQVQARMLADLHNAILGRVTQAALPYANVLLKHINTAHLEERKRIARALHDRAGHAIAISLQQLDLRQLALQEGDEEEGQFRLDVLAQSLREAAAMIHETAVELGRTHTDGGLVAALEAYVDLHGCDRVMMDVRDREQVDAAPQWILEEIYFAVREAIRNAMVHSNSPSIFVRLGASDGELNAEVEDQGAGIEGDPFAGNSSGKGLVSLFERVKLLGGDLSVRTGPDQGTTITLCVPVP